MLTFRLSIFFSYLSHGGFTPCSLQNESPKPGLKVAWKVTKPDVFWDEPIEEFDLMAETQIPEKYIELCRAISRLAKVETVLALPVSSSPSGRSLLVSGCAYTIPIRDLADCLRRHLEIISTPSPIEQRTP